MMTHETESKNTGSHCKSTHLVDTLFSFLVNEKKIMTNDLIV